MSYNTFPKNPFPPNSEDYGGGGGSYELPIAGAETLGGVKVGTGLEINAETGVLSNPNPTPYVLPIAGAETLGGVKVGTGLEINAETGVLSSSKKGVIGVDNATYTALPEADKNSGDLYIVNTNREVPTNPIDMSNITKFEEGSTTVTATSATKTTIATDGQSIGATYYYTTPIDVTDLDEIICHVSATSHYTPFADRLALTIGLCSTAPVAYASSYTDLNYGAFEKISDNGEFDVSIDVSALTGNQYIVVNCAGWTATIEDLKDDATTATEVAQYDMYFKSTKLLTKEV